LTGAFNHGYFVTRLKEAAEQSRHTGEPMALIMLDIDHFKEYNDRYGHVIGDQVLKKSTIATGPIWGSH
jgi:diguanylate cyclase (GGDEF)-like protein